MRDRAGVPPPGNCLKEGPGRHYPEDHEDDEDDQEVPVERPAGGGGSAGGLFGGISGEGSTYFFDAAGNGEVWLAG